MGIFSRKSSKMPEVSEPVEPVEPVAPIVVAAEPSELEGPQGSSKRDMLGKFLSVRSHTTHPKSASAERK